MDSRLDQIIAEQAVIRRLLEALVTALAPEETPAERSLVEALDALTATVDDTGSVVSAMHSHVSSLARAPRVSEHA